MTDSNQRNPQGAQAPAPPAPEAIPKQPAPTLSLTYVQHVRSQTGWAKKWLFEKSELVPLHLTWMFTALLAVFAAIAWREATHSTKALQDQLEVLREDGRPWAFIIKADPKSFEALDNSTVRLMVDFTLNNSGRRPAIDFRIGGGFRFSKIGDADMTVDEQCSYIEEDQYRTSFSDVVFPGQPYTHTIAFVGDKKKRGLSP